LWFFSGVLNNCMILHLWVWATGIPFVYDCALWDGVGIEG
jgi:hypothetical protein